MKDLMFYVLIVVWLLLLSIIVDMWIKVSFAATLTEYRLSCDKMTETLVVEEYDGTRPCDTVCADGRHIGIWAEMAGKNCGGKDEGKTQCYGRNIIRTCYIQSYCDGDKYGKRKEVDCKKYGGRIIIRKEER